MAWGCSLPGQLSCGKHPGDGESSGLRAGSELVSNKKKFLGRISAGSEGDEDYSNLLAGCCDL